MPSHLHELLVRIFRGEPERLKALLPAEFGDADRLVADDRDPTVSPSSQASLRSADLLLSCVAADGAERNEIDFPEILDPARAAEDPIAAILSALAHPRTNHVDRVARSMESAFAALDPDERSYYTDVVLDALAKRAPGLLERFMPITVPPNYEIQFEPLKQLIARGREEGRAEGRAGVARAMLAKGLEREQVAEILGVTSEELDLLIDEHR